MKGLGCHYKVSKYAYIYKYNEFSNVLDNIKCYYVKDTYISPQYEKYNIIVHVKQNETKDIMIMIFRTLRLMIIFTEKFYYIKDLICNALLEKYSLVDKNTLCNLLENKFTVNLTKIVMNIDCCNKEEELFEVIGSELSYNDFFDDIITNEYGTETEIKSYSVQPRKYKYLIHILATNKIEFNSHYSAEEQEKIIYEFILCLCKGEK